MRAKVQVLPIFQAFKKAIKELVEKSVSFGYMNFMVDKEICVNIKQKVLSQNSIIETTHLNSDVYLIKIKSSPWISFSKVSSFNFITSFICEAFLKSYELKSQEFHNPELLKSHRFRILDMNTFYWVPRISGELHKSLSSPSWVGSDLCLSECRCLERRRF